MLLGINNLSRPPGACIVSALPSLVLGKPPFEVGRYPRIQRPVAALEYIDQIHQTVNATIRTKPVMTANAPSVLVKSSTASCFCPSKNIWTGWRKKREPMRATEKTSREGRAVGAGI